MDDLWNEAWDSLIQEVQREADEEDEAAEGSIRLSNFQKCTSAIRQLAYAGPTDMFDEYQQIGETTSLEVFRRFCKGMREVFGPEFLRKPNSDECQRLLDIHGVEWKNCPVAWKAQFTASFKSKHPSMILEAVADYCLRIWHAYFGVAVSNNDINVLQSSPLFNDECRGEGPEISFVANGTQYRMGYYLADGIYPRWPVFVKTLRQPAGARRQYFARKQEAARKDVERVFGVLQADGPLYAARHEFERWAPEDGASTSHGVASAPIQMGVPRSNEYLIQCFADIRRSTTHDQLQVDLIEEVWARRGGGVA
ncbi:uncharacterized protein LOC125209539 [Salvia hispanica]|uniref:uncharacterized protein LOC125209539 n=1 Tax=Salvia hispanica TaxID=49212 RepID=UPI0020091310|nr:uncharacterized protein LOC125209539 [Salvia hispanica]